MIVSSRVLGYVKVMKRIIFVFIQICLTIKCLGECDAVKNINNIKFNTFLTNVVNIPYGQTNIVHYAGEYNGKSVIVHTTEQGKQFYQIDGFFVDISLLKPHTCDISDWILIKNNNENCFNCLDMRQHIKYFVDDLPINSALVVPELEWYERQDKFVLYNKTFIVKYTRSNDVKPGERLLVSTMIHLWDEKNTNEKIFNLKKCTGEIRYTQWENSKICDIGILEGAKAICIDEEIVAPFSTWWEFDYAGYLPFDNKYIIEYYSKQSKK